MTYALRVTWSLAVDALIAQEIALMALAALGLSGDPFHEPFHDQGPRARRGPSPRPQRHGHVGTTAPLLLPCLSESAVGRLSDPNGGERLTFCDMTNASRLTREQMPPGPAWASVSSRHRSQGVALECREHTPSHP